MSKTDDKKEYADMMKIMDAEASITSTLNKLGQIAIDSEDEKLKTAAAGLASHIRSLFGPKLSGKNRLLTLAANFKAGHDLQRKQFAERIVQIWTYCKQMSEEQEPQWQILALRAGWTPPAVQ
ncbi:hypothetical protein [Caballeronia sp. LjRoot31]|uniref:hypothetical protein n=1 Tax=Caballeronia sp. LjRoot31 TaxID=3342324 RepID=UPI003ECF16BE